MDEFELLLFLCSFGLYDYVVKMMKYKPHLKLNTCKKGNSGKKKSFCKGTILIVSKDCTKLYAMINGGS